MKTYLLTLIFSAAALMANGQELSVDRVDEFDGKVVKKTKYYRIGTNSAGNLYCGAARIDDIIFLDIWTYAEQGCGGADGNFVIFLFEDGTTYRNDKDEAKIDCKEKASCYYVVSPSDFEGQVTEKIRFAMSDGYIDYLWDGEFSIAELIQALQ